MSPRSSSKKAKGPAAAPDVYVALLFVAVASLVVGNLAAIAQTNLKRMLAYSTISQMGFVVLGLASGVVNGQPDNHALNAYSSAMFYAITYVLTTLGSFGLVMLLARQGFESEQISDLAGLFIAESDIVVERALEAGYRMVHGIVDAQRPTPLPSVLPSDVTVFAASVPVLQRITGMGVHRGMMACFRRRALPSVEAVVADARRVIVAEGINNPTNIGGTASTTRCWAGRGTTRRTRSGRLYLGHLV